MARGLKLEYDPGKHGSKPYWYASTGDNDGTGATPLDAVCSLVAQILDDKDES